MNSYAAFLLLALFSCSAFAQEKDTFRINGQDIVVPVPEGFVRVTDEMTAVDKLVQQMGDPVNDTLAYYISESEVPEAMAGEFPGLERTFMLKVGKQLRTVIIGRNDFSEIKEGVKAENEKVLSDLKYQISENMRNASEGVSREFDLEFALEISGIVPLESHYESENALSYSMYIDYGGTSDSVNIQDKIAATTTTVNAAGVVLFLYSYASRDDLEWTREASKSWAESVMASNSEPPAESPNSKGFDWGVVGRNTIIGAITGGLGALIGAFLIKRRKKRAGG